MANADRSPQDQKEKSDHPLRDSFDRATRWFGNLLAPLVIVAYARDVQEAFDYILDNPLLTSVFSIVFVVVLGYNLVSTLKLQVRDVFRPRASELVPEDNGYFPDRRATEEAPPDRYQSSRGALLRWIAIAASCIALIILAYFYVAVFVTGIHFVAVASAPDKDSAIREIQSLNEYFDSHGYRDLQAKAHASTGTGSPWYMISIGGWHTSDAAAKRTFQRAKKALGPRMRSDAYIYSTKNISPRRTLSGYIQRLIRWIESIFSG